MYLLVTKEDCGEGKVEETRSSKLFLQVRNLTPLYIPEETEDSEGVNGFQQGAPQSHVGQVSCCVVVLSQSVRVLWRPGDTDMMRRLLGAEGKIIGVPERSVKSGASTDPVINSDGTRITQTK